MENKKIIMNVNEIIDSQGKNKKLWEKLYIEININLMNNNYDTISYLNNNLILNKNVDLTLDIIDFIIDYGSEDIITLITPEFLKNIRNLLTTRYKSENDILFKILFLIQKWGTSCPKYKNYLNFRNIYEKLKKENIQFPSKEVQLKTYLNFITLNEIKRFKIKLDNWKYVNNFISFPKTIYRKTLNEIVGRNKNKCSTIRKDPIEQFPNEYENNNIGINKNDIDDIKEGDNINEKSQNPINPINSTDNNDKLKNSYNNDNDNGIDDNEYNNIIKNLINIDNNRSTVEIINQSTEKVVPKPLNDNLSLIKENNIYDKSNKNEFIEKQNSKINNELPVNNNNINNNIINLNNSREDFRSNINNDNYKKNIINNSNNNENNNKKIENEKKTNNIQSINNNVKVVNNSIYQNNYLNTSTNIRNNSFNKNMNVSNKPFELKRNNPSINKKVQSQEKINPNYTMNCINNISNYYMINKNDNFIETFKSNLGKKINEINEWIDKGRFSYYNTYTGLLSNQIRSLSKDIKKCDDLINYYMRNNNNYCLDIIYKLKNDIFQTCERYNNLNSGKKVDSFKSAFLKKSYLEDNPYATWK